MQATKASSSRRNCLLWKNNRECWYL